MKCLIFLSLLFVIACNSGGGSGSRSAQCSGQPILSSWVDDGGLGIDLTSLELNGAVTAEKLAGDLNPLSVTPGEVCVVNVVTSGDECSGDIHVVSSVRKNPAAMPFTTACVDIEKSYRYERSSRGIVFGVTGTAGIEYH